MFRYTEHVANSGGRQITIGDQVRAARQQRGYSVRRLATLIGVSAGTISAIENERTGVTVDRLACIAEALGTDLGSLLRRADFPPPSAPAHGGDWRAFGEIDLDPVLRAAIDSFVEAGYHGTSIRAIAVRAGLSVPGLYHYYASKQELLVRILDLTMDDLEWRLAATAATGPSALDRVALLVEALALFHTLRPALAFLGASEMRSLERPDRQRIAGRRTAVQHQLDQQIDGALADGTAATRTPRETGRAIVTMCTSLPQWFDPAGPTSPRAIAAQYADLALVMIGALRPGAAGAATAPG